QDVLIIAAQEDARRGAGDQQVAAAVPPSEHVAPVAYEDVVSPRGAAVAAQYVFDVGDGAAHSGGRAHGKIDDDVAGVRRVIQRVGAWPAIDGATDAGAVAEDKGIVARPTSQVLDGGERGHAGHVASVGAGDIEGQAGREVRQIESVVTTAAVEG